MLWCVCVCDLQFDFDIVIALAYRSSVRPCVHIGLFQPLALRARVIPIFRLREEWDVRFPFSFVCLSERSL